MPLSAPVKRDALGGALAHRAPWALVVAGAAVLGLTALFPAWTNDLFGHLAAGREIVALGRVPHHDSFSFYFDQAQPWRNHNWASGLLFHLVHVALGIDGLVLLKVVLCAALGGLLVATCSRRPLAAPICALILLWTALSVRPRFTVRPHLFGLLCCALLLYALVVVARLAPKQRVWPIVCALGVLQVAWGNLHGSAPMAFLLTGAFVVGHLGEPLQARRYALLLLVQAAMSCITPFGPALMLETVNHVSSEGTRFFIGEWGPLYTSDNPWDVPAVTAMLALTLLVAKPLWQSGAAGRSWLLVTLGMLLMAYRSLRFVAEPLLLGAPCVASGLALRLSELQRRTPRTLTAAFTGIAALAALPIAYLGPNIPPYQPMGLGLSTRTLPVEPGRWLAAHRPRARSACLMEDCWYLSFAVPRGLVIMDGRQAVYPLDVLQSLSTALTKPSQLFDLLDRKGADAVVLRHTHDKHAATIAALLQHPGFGLASIGDRHVLFVRDLAREHAIVELWPNLSLRAFTPAQAARATEELGRIGRQGAAQYVGFQRALLLVSPDLRSGGYDGLQSATGSVQRARHAQALRQLAPGLPANENLPIVQVLATMLNLSLCRLEDAEQHLGFASVEGENRHTIALRIELALRRGDLEAAQRMLSRLDGTRADAWLERLRRDLDVARQQPLCAPVS